MNNLTEQARELAAAARVRRLRHEAAERERRHYAERAAKAERYNTPEMPALLKVQAE